MLKTTVRPVGLSWWVLAFAAAGVAAYAWAVAGLADLRPPFVRQLIDQWPLPAVVHFVGGGVAILIGAVQLNSWLRIRSASAHRWLGRVYAVAVLLSGSAALILAARSTAGAAAATGFGLLGLCWLGSTIYAWLLIRQRRMQEHRRWMIRSYALTLAALALRIYLPLSLVAGFPMAVAYPVIAWLCWVPNVVVAEWYLRARPIAS